MDLWFKYETGKQEIYFWFDDRLFDLWENLSLFLNFCLFKWRSYKKSCLFLLNRGINSLIFVMCFQTTRRKLILKKVNLKEVSHLMSPSKKSYQQ